MALNVNSSGAGVATLQSTNTYSGGTTLVAGTLAANTTGALPGYNTSGSVTFSGGALQVPLSAWATSDIDTLLSNATKTSGKLGLDTTNGDLTQWTAFTTSNLGGLGLQKAGTNVLILNQANTYTGSTAITGGTLRVDTGGNLNGASNIALSTGAALVFNTSSDVAITGAITGGTQNTANVTQQGGGKLTLSGNNGFLGKLVVSNGTVSIATWNSGTNAGPLGGTQGGTQGQTELGGGSGTTGTLLYTGGSAASNKVLYLTPGGTGVINIDNGSTVMNLSLTTGTSVQISGSGNLVKAGPGTLVLSNNYSTYSGSTTINAGTLQVDGKSPAASTVAVTTNGTLSGGGTILGNSTLTGNGIINLSSSGSIAGTLGVTGGNWNGAGSVGGVVNSSSGTFTIGSAGNLTASSGLSVTGGTTLVNGTLTGGVSVSPGATLGGAGSITGLVSVNGNLSPGASIAKLESGAVTFGTGSTFTYEINHLAAPSAAGDLQVVHGDSLATNLSLSGTVNLVLTDLAGPTGTFAANTSLSLIQYAGGWNGGFFTYQGTTLGNDQPFIDANGNHWKITYDSAGGGLNFATALAGSHFITLSNLTAVPEPGSLLALGCLIGSGALLRRRAR